MGDLIQFGKYKGRPVEDMLADATYMQWLEGQPWFREKYGHILQMRDAEAANRTPVHNRMQAAFLDDAYCLAFVLVACPDCIQRTRENAAMDHANWIKFLPVGADREEATAKVAVDRVGSRFEFENADVCIEFCVRYLPAGIDHGRYMLDHYGYGPRFHIEIKPTVGDEYPAVLRQMMRNKTRYLFVGRYIGEGASRAQFVQIFAASEITVVFQDDVERAL